MAKPRIFISSTFYDLKHIRSSIDTFISSLGFESILSEKGDIAYSPDQPLDTSCYREAQSCDIFVLIIGGRYGSPSSLHEGGGGGSDFFERYESITKLEYRAALEKDIPVYILVETGVYNEFQTYRRNRDNQSIKYAHVDSINIFLFLDEILRQKRNNPVFNFEKYSEMEAWLRDQWAGLFGEFLNRRESQEGLVGLARQVSELSEVNQTLRRYIETIVSKIAPDTSEELISSERHRLEEYEKINESKQLYLFEFLQSEIGVPPDKSLDLIRSASDFGELKKSLAKVATKNAEHIEPWFSDHAGPVEDTNRAREIFGLPLFDLDRK